MDCVSTHRITNRPEVPRFFKKDWGPSEAIQRPGLLAGTEKVANIHVPVLMEKPLGADSYQIFRPGFEEPRILPRIRPDFDNLQAVDLSNFGQKVQLSDKTLDELLNIRVPDPTDLTWLAEKVRLAAAGRSNELPLGRPQRTITSRISFGDAKLSMDNQVQAIRAAVQAGRTESKQDMLNLAAAIAKVVEDIDAFDRLSTDSQTVIKKAIEGLDIPRTWEAAGLSRRLWNWDMFKGNKGPIHEFIMANHPAGLSFDTPVWNRTNRTIIKTATEPGNSTKVRRAVKLNRVRKDLKEKDEWFDAAKRTIITKSQAMEMLSRGVDSTAGEPIESKDPIA